MDLVIRICPSNTGLADKVLIQLIKKEEKRISRRSFDISYSINVLVA